MVAVVDEEQSVRAALERLMRSAGLAVTSFSSGTAFLQFLQERTPACVVLDLHMPPLDGFDILEALQRAGTPLAIIVVTADDTPQNRSRAFSHGVCTYLSKPVDEAILLDAVRAAIRE